MEPEDLYEGATRDELTGLHNSFYFSTEFNRRVDELKRSGGSDLLLMLNLPEDTPEEKVRAVAEYWKQNFIRVCRYEKKNYSFIALDEDAADAQVKEQEILDALAAEFPGIAVRVNSAVIDSSSGSLDELTAQLS